ncbi:hypothetical protein C4J92_3966 [Pseudomonas sp. R3-18-08]|nr:hypothetical protein C4J92_3966 [Pseudomonas sp. R3-18-08]
MAVCQLMEVLADPPLSGASPLPPLNSRVFDFFAIKSPA